MRKLALVLILPILLLCGCYRQDTAANTDPTVTQTAYILTHVESGVIRYSADEFETAGSLYLYSDGTAQLYYADQTVNLLYDDASMWTSDAENELHPYHISGSVLTLDYYSDTLTFLRK